MIKTDKEKYRNLCLKESSIPVFSRDWWLDCVCGTNNWDVIITESEDIITACMPIYKHYPMVIAMPSYTQTMGIWFNPSSFLPDYRKELFRKQQLCEEIIQKIPNNKSFLQNFNFAFTDWLPFYWNGYQQTTKYTYIIQDINSLDNIWNNFSNEIKKNILKAQNKYQLTVKRGLSVDDFLNLNEQIFDRQGKSPVKHQILKNLINTARSKDTGDIWGAYDEQGKLHAAQFLVWQETCAYCVAGGSSRDFGKTGAHALVIWETIQFASTKSASFDFMGSMIKGVEYFNRGFGSEQIPYYAISKGKLSFIEKVFHYSIKKIKGRT